MKTKPSTSRKRQGVFPLPRGWFAVVHDENGKLRQLGVFRTKRDATSVFHTVTISGGAADATDITGELLADAISVTDKNSAASGPVDVDVATGCAGYRVDVRSDAVSR
jgi:hypothetical protein